MFCGYFKQAAPSALLIVLKYSPPVNLVQLRHSVSQWNKRDATQRETQSFALSETQTGQTDTATYNCNTGAKPINCSLPAKRLFTRLLYVIACYHTHTQTVTHTHISSHTVLQYEVLQMLFCTHERLHKKRFEICETLTNNDMKQQHKSMMRPMFPKLFCPTVH